MHSSHAHPLNEDFDYDGEGMPPCTPPPNYYSRQSAPYNYYSQYGGPPQAHHPYYGPGSMPYYTTGAERGGGGGYSAYMMSPHHTRHP